MPNPFRTPIHERYFGTPQKNTPASTIEAPRGKLYGLLHGENSNSAKPKKTATPRCWFAFLLSFLFVSASHEAAAVVRGRESSPGREQEKEKERGRDRQDQERRRRQQRQQRQRRWLP